MKFNEVTGVDEKLILHVFEEGYIEEREWHSEYIAGRHYHLYNKNESEVCNKPSLESVLNHAKLLNWTELRLPEVKFIFLTERGDQFTFDTEKEAYLWAARTGSKGRIEKHIQ